MSRVNCCVYGCNSVYKNNPELTFHHFPNEGQKINYINDLGISSFTDRKTVWMLKLKLEKAVTKHMRVCSKHFTEDDFTTPAGFYKRYLKKSAVPSQNLPVSAVSKSTESNKEADIRRNKRLKRVTKKRQLNEDGEVESVNVTGKEEEVKKNVAAVAHMELETGHTNISDADTCSNQPHVKIFCDVGIQTDKPKTMQDAAIRVNTTRYSSISDFIQTDKALNILTGIPSFSLLNSLVQLVSMYFKDSKRNKLPLKQRIILVFLKLKLDLSYTAMAIFCENLSMQSCKKIFYDTVEQLSHVLRNFIYIPPKEEVLNKMPLCLQKHQNVRIALDCTEIHVQVVKKLCCKVKLYSHYKKHHSLKFMTAVTPCGFIVHASAAYGGRASDKSIFEQSGIIQQLIPNVDQIMVDNGFLIEGICEDHAIKLVRPPFLRKNKQFNQTEAIFNRSVAAARVHIERVSARIKVFRIFRKTFPQHLVKIVDDIFLIICGFVNLSNLILKDEHLLKE